MVKNAEFIEKVLEAMGTVNVPEHVATREGPFLLLNQAGTRPPLIWCFNTWAEALLHGRALGPDQPLVSMISLNFFKMPDARKALIYPDLIKTLANRVAPLVKDGQYVVGGNCNAARVGEGIAQHLFFAKMRCPLLIVLDHVPIHAYPGSLLMLFGTKSPLNPFARGLKFEEKWLAFHRSPRWGFIDAEHGQFFVQPGLSQLSQHLKMAIQSFAADGQICSGLQELEE